MTDNSAKRAQNAQMRSKDVDANEPEALKQMRLKREAMEEAQSEKGMLDAEQRAKTGNFVSGQDVRELRLAEQVRASGGSGAKGGGESDEAPTRDIRETLRKMQGSEKRKRVKEESLLHQSEVDSPPIFECGAAIAAFLNGKHAAALGAFAIQLNPELAQSANKANMFMNGALVVPDAVIRSLDERGLDLEARVVETGFFGNQKEKKIHVRVDFANGAVHSHADGVKMAVIDMLRTCGLDQETASVLSMPGIGSRGWSIPEDLFLNEVPSRPPIREWFYRDACDALEVALRDEKFLASARGRIAMEVSEQMQGMSAASCSVRSYSRRDTQTGCAARDQSRDGCLPCGNDARARKGVGPPHRARAQQEGQDLHSGAFGRGFLHRSSAYALRDEEGARGDGLAEPQGGAVRGHPGGRDSRPAHRKGVLRGKRGWFGGFRRRGGLCGGGQGRGFHRDCSAEHVGGKRLRPSRRDGPGYQRQAGASDQPQAQGQAIVGGGDDGENKGTFPTDSEIETTGALRGSLSVSLKCSAGFSEEMAIPLLNLSHASISRRWEGGLSASRLQNLSATFITSVCSSRARSSCFQSWEC